MLNPDISCLENSVDHDHHNVMVDYRLAYGFLQIMMVRHAVFNFSMNLTNEKHSLSED